MRISVRLLLLTAVADFHGVISEIQYTLSFVHNIFFIVCVCFASLRAVRSQHVDGYDEGKCHQCAPHDPHRRLDQLDLFRIRNK